MHVENPQPPRVVFGDMDRFHEQHDTHVEARKTKVERLGEVRYRAIRKDRHTMASIVISYPVPCSAISTGEARAKLEAWEQRNLDWLKEKYGDQLKVMLMHDDEEHPNIHAWLLPEDPDARAITLHPGKMAKHQAEREAKDKGYKPREAVKLGNRALKAAMTKWQDEYYAAVGAPSGLTRAGPRRRRLTRQQWRTEKASAAATAARIQEAEDNWLKNEKRSAELNTRRDAVLFSEKESMMREWKLDGRERKIEKKETELHSVLQSVQEMIGDAADSLGVGSTLQDIRDAITAAGIELKPPEEDDGLSM